MSHKLKPVYKKKVRPVITQILEIWQPERQGCRDYHIKDLRVEQRRCIGQTETGGTYMFSRERFFNAAGGLVRELLHAIRPYEPDF